MNKKRIYWILKIVSFAVMILAAILMKKQAFDSRMGTVFMVVMTVAAFAGYFFAEFKLKRMNAAEPDAEDAEDDTAEDDDISDVTDNGRTALFVEGFPSDRLYFVFATQMYYAFVHTGHAELGIKEDAVSDKPLTDGDRLHANPKDIWLAKSEITEGKLKMKRCISTQLPSCASLKLKTRDGKKYSFIILQELDEKTIRDFFADVEKRFV